MSISFLKINNRFERFLIQFLFVPEKKVACLFSQTLKDQVKLQHADVFIFIN